MGLLAWIVLGALAGFIANLLVGGREGVIGTILLGILGAVVGGFIAETVFHRGTVNGLNLESLFIAVLGAIVILMVWRLATRRRGLIA